jgi:hypothetical protein
MTEETITMLRRHEEGVEREAEVAGEAGAASSRMSGQSRSNTMWLRYTDPGGGADAPPLRRNDATVTPARRPPPSPPKTNMSSPAA